MKIKYKRTRSRMRSACGKLAHHVLWVDDVSKVVYEVERIESKLGEILLDPSSVLVNKSTEIQENFKRFQL